MIELHIPSEDAVYNTLADGCHDIIYEVGSCFEWQYPETPGWAIARFSFRTEDQMIETVRMMKDLLDRVAPSKARLILNGPV